MLNKLTRIPHASVVGRLLRWPLRCIPAGIALPIFSGINRGMKWVAGSATHGAWLGTYEIEKQAYLASMLKPDMTFFDLGANAGFYTLAAARLVGKNGRVFAFEPLAENVANLRRHVQLNQFHNVAVVQSAVAEKFGIASFQIGPHNAMGSLSEKDSGYLVPTVTLDAIIAAGLPVPDVVKMDIEGAGSAALHGAHTLLIKRKTVWLIALHGSDQAKRCQEILVSYGYHIYDLAGKRLETQQDIPDEIFASAQ